MPHRLDECSRRGGAPDVAVELRGSPSGSPASSPTATSTSTVRRGTVHALVGENGAGKSTLMKILYGMQQPDEGTIAIDGTRGDLPLPADAIDAGIGMVHQHFMLADNLTVLENIVLGSEPMTGGRLDVGAARRRINEISDAYGLDVDPDALVEDLGVGARQRVEILKVLYRGAKILILDEPTAVLVPQEVDELFGNLRELKAEGLTIIFISHKLDEVLHRRRRDHRHPARHHRRHGRPEDGHHPAARRDDGRLRAAGRPRLRESTVTDVAVLRLRRAVRSRPTPERHARAARRHRPSPSTRARCSASPASRATARPSWSTRSWACGRRPRARVDRWTATDITTLPTRRRREAGIGYIPEDRHRQGLLLEAPLWENRILGHQTRAPDCPGLLLDRPAARADTERIVEDVRRPHPRHRGHRRRAVRRQPAEADRRPRDERHTRSC